MSVVCAFEWAVPCIYLMSRRLYFLWKFRGGLYDFTIYWYSLLSIRFLTGPPRTVANRASLAWQSCQRFVRYFASQACLGINEVSSTMDCIVRLRLCSSAVPVRLFPPPLTRLRRRMDRRLAAETDGIPDCPVPNCNNFRLIAVSVTDRPRSPN